MNAITVHVYKTNSSKFLYMYFDDPMSGRRQKRSTKQTKKKDADKAAGAWEKELNEGTYFRPVKLAWESFITTYENEVFPSLSRETQRTRSTVLNLLTDYFHPKTAAHVATTRMMAEFQAQLRTRGKKPREKKSKCTQDQNVVPVRQPYSEQSIVAYLAHLRPIWEWAKTQGFISRVPDFKMPRIPQDDLMRGRPITGEEFERMLTATDKVREHDSAQWKRFLRGLWLSGLRLSEALKLSWDDSEAFCVSTDGRAPQFRILAEAQKRRKSEFVPMADDFWDMIDATPAQVRQGPVLFVDNGAGQQVSSKTASKVISKIGKQAGVVTDWERKQFASAHDLRRSFGTRWAKRVAPLILQKLMRHSKIETTLRYYASTAGDFANEAIWGDRMAKSSQFGSQSPTDVHADA